MSFFVFTGCQVCQIESVLARNGGGCWFAKYRVLLSFLDGTGSGFFPALRAVRFSGAEREAPHAWGGELLFFARFDFVQYSFFLSDLLAPLFLAFECDIFSCRSSRHLMHALYFASVYIIMAKAVLRLLRAAYRNEARYLV